MKWTEPAYGKLNLTLDILGKLENGYHSLSMVMQSVSLADRVTLCCEGEKGIHVFCGEGAPEGEENIVWKAAKAFFEYCGITEYSVQFWVEKKIPSQAGMGGGSSDAAAALRLLNRAYGKGLTADELRSLGSRIGADVPFCITGGTIQAEGIGEILTPVAELPNCWILLCKPPIGVSTPQAFKESDNAPAVPPKTPDMVQALETGSLEKIAAALGNRFQEILQIPQIRRIIRNMEENGALGACMTGSGSVVFGIFCEKEKAEQAANRLKGLGNCYVVQPISEYSL